MTYDINTGNLTNSAGTMSLLEDFWLPRREGGRGTEVSTLPGGQNLGEIEDIVYFQKRLYKSLNVPLSRLEQEAQFSLGRTSELTRDEQYFQKFINGIRRRFAKMIVTIVGKHCVLKGVCTKEEWEEWKSNIFVEFLTDNYFTELKNAEIMSDRVERLDRVSQYVGEYFSREWVMKEILMMSDDDIDALNKQIKKELGSGEVETDPGENEDGFDYNTEPTPAAEKPTPKIDATKAKPQGEGDSDGKKIKESLENEALHAEITLLNKLSETLDE